MLLDIIHIHIFSYLDHLWTETSNDDHSDIDNSHIYIFIHIYIYIAIDIYHSDQTFILQKTTSFVWSSKPLVG